MDGRRSHHMPHVGSGNIQLTNSNWERPAENCTLTTSLPSRFSHLLPGLLGVQQPPQREEELQSDLCVPGLVRPQVVQGTENDRKKSKAFGLVGWRSAWAFVVPCKFIGTHVRSEHMSCPFACTANSSVSLAACSQGASVLLHFARSCRAGLASILRYPPDSM